MPTLRIQVSDESWPVVVAALSAAAGPPPAGERQLAWAERVVAEWCRAEIAALIEPPPPEPVRRDRRIRPSRVRT